MAHESTNRAYQLSSMGKLAPEPTHVLVVDDEQAIREILVDFLELEGFIVHTAENGKQALGLLRENRFDAVLSDVKMPDMGGFELLEAIKRENIDTVIVLMTGYGTIEAAIDAMKRGVYDYITKPFRVEEIPPILQRGIERHQLEQENYQLKELIKLYHASELLSSEQDITTSITQITKAIGEAFRADGILIYGKTHEQQDDFSLISGRGLPFEYPDSWTPSLTWLTEQYENDASVYYHESRAQAIFVNAPYVQKLSAFMSIPMRVRGELFGMFHLYSFTPNMRYHEGHRKALLMFASHTAAAIENSRMYDNLKVSFAQTMEGFARALEAKDKYTAGHSDRVANYSVLIANQLDLTPDEVESIRHAALLHDIGKLGIRSEDLNKPEKLTQAEYLMFQSHPSLGARILEPLDIFNELVPAVTFHHEHWDGSGYPDGLDHEQIPLVARIIAIADTYDAITSDRAYRKALSHEYAMQELQRCAGSQFDPKLVKIFCEQIVFYRKHLGAQGLPVPV